MMRSCFPRGTADRDDRASGFSDAFRAQWTLTTINTRTDIREQQTSSQARNRPTQVSTSKALAAAAAAAERIMFARAAGGSCVCAWNVALDRVRVIDWSQLEPRISLRMIHIGRLSVEALRLSRPILSRRLERLLGLVAGAAVESSLNCSRSSSLIG